jgi:pimeloyl-ACP methyl ester carboxylesterase/ketosteroid isomerase-like protein
MSRENVELVRRVAEQYNEAGELPWELIDPAVEWVADPDAFVAGTYRGHQGVRQFFARLAEGFDRFQLEVDSFRDADERVVALGHVTVHGEQSGITTEQPLASVWQVRDGRIVAYRSYLEAAEALKAMGLWEQGNRMEDGVDEMASTDAPTGYAPVNDLEMYYERHGTGRPLILLPGAYMTIDLMGAIVPGLAQTRQVIAVEPQGHGRTADADRPITYEQMADDAAALVRHLELESADFFGYSMGGGIALQVAIRHPELVRKLVVASTTFRSDGMPAEALEMFPSITPELFAGSPIEQEYLRTAPNPGDFPKLVEKMKQLDVTPFAWPEEDIRGIDAPTLIILGDSDGVRLEHAVEFFRLRGGGVMGDLAGMPQSQLAVLPGTAHFMPPGLGLLDRADWLLAMIPPFLDAPPPESE